MKAKIENSLKSRFPVLSEKRRNELTDGLVSELNNISDPSVQKEKINAFIKRTLPGFGDGLIEDLSEGITKEIGSSTAPPMTVEDYAKLMKGEEEADDHVTKVDLGIKDHL